MHAFWIVTLVFGVIASIIAQSKGRNSLGWFVAGMLVGPFGLVVALLPPVVRQGQYVSCPACREVIREDATSCRYCHHLLERT